MHNEIVKVGDLFQQLGGVGIQNVKGNAGEFAVKSVTHCGFVKWAVALILFRQSLA